MYILNLGLNIQKIRRIIHTAVYALKYGSTYIYAVLRGVRLGIRGGWDLGSRNFIKNLV